MHIDQVALLILPELVDFHLLLVGPAVEFIFAVFLVLERVFPKLIIPIVPLVVHGVDVAEDGIEDREGLVLGHLTLIRPIILLAKTNYLITHKNKSDILGTVQNNHRRNPSRAPGLSSSSTIRDRTIKYRWS